ncbi:hypothetical protein BH10ACT11_BH10ACT11_22090 [soil metagenome]
MSESFGFDRRQVNDANDKYQKSARAITANRLVLASPGSALESGERTIHSPQLSTQGAPQAHAKRPLSSREREVLGLLSNGMNGAAIAERLVLSPETIRTHVRNAMDKLGAATRSQAVAVALERGEITREATAAGPSANGGRPAGAEDPVIAETTLRALIAGIATIPDVDAAALYLTEDDGSLCLRLVARAGAHGLERTPMGAGSRIHLGEGKVGRVALEARTELLSESPFPPMIAAPMHCAGRLIGVICVAARSSRPTNRRELLLVEALGNRIADVIDAGGDIKPGLRGALERFRVSWSDPGS